MLKNSRDFYVGHFHVLMGGKILSGKLWSCPLTMVATCGAYSLRQAAGQHSTSVSGFTELSCDNRYKRVYKVHQDICFKERCESTSPKKPQTGASQGPGQGLHAAHRVVGKGGDGIGRARSLGPETLPLHSCACSEAVCLCQAGREGTGPCCHTGHGATVRT